MDPPIIATSAPRDPVATSSATIIKIPVTQKYRPIRLVSLGMNPMHTGIKNASNAPYWFAAPIGPSSRPLCSPMIPRSGMLKKSISVISDEIIKVTRIALSNQI